VPDFRATLRSEARETSMMQSNPANFGSDYSRHCMCEVAGQVPCPAWQALPLEMTGKGRKKLQQMEEEAAMKSQ